MPQTEKADLNQYKNRLSDYLDYKGIAKKNDKYSCVNPQHEDSNPSASVYENSGGQLLNCNSCGFKGDIFDCAGELIGERGQENFAAQLKEIQDVFGGAPTAMSPTAVSATSAKKKKADPEKATVVPLDRDTALEKFSSETILKIGSGVFNGFGEKALPETDEKFRAFGATGWYPYYNATGLIDLMVVRLEDQHKKKEVLTYYWNGKNVAMKAYPVLIYGRHDLVKFPDLPVMIHEGEKCCDIAKKALPDFVHITWNGGGKKFYVPDWSILKGREVFLLPDDDKPGIETMHRLNQLLKGDQAVNSKEIPIFEKAKKLKKKGADIEEILQCYSPQEITTTIFNLRRQDAPRQEESNSKNEQVVRDNSDGVNSGNNNPLHGNYNFKILGIADDDRAYFLDHTDRLVSLETTAINANTLSDIGTYTWFKQNLFHYADPTAKDWLQVVDDIRVLTKQTDFDMENVRGRGAWKDNDGNICYHDGKKTTGRYDPEWTFIRKPQHKIGIHQKQLDFGTRSEIIATAHNFSFATKADCIRFFSWAALAPFAGALTWRPAFQLTGESGTGKSTLMNLVKKISLSLAVNGGSTTEAAVRQYVGTDSGSTIVDEAESKNHRDRDRIEGIFALMRASTSDDSPKTIKGSKNGKATVFEMRQMFGFASINASVDNVADDNRIIRINLKKNENPDYLKNIRKINALLSYKNCEGIRAFTWQNLTKIIGLAERLGYIIQEVTGQDQRYSDGESILLAANMIVWENHRGDEDDDFLREYVTGFYRDQVHEDKRDETEEMIISILDQTTVVLVDDLKNKRISMSFRELLTKMKLYLEQRAAQKENDYANEMFRIPTIGKEEYRDYKRIVEQNGLSVHGGTMELVIVQNHKVIMKELGLSYGYHRQLERHKNIRFKNHGVNIDGTTKRCTVIAGFLEYDNEEE